MTSTITDDDIGRRLWQDAKAQAMGTAALAGPGPDQKKLTPEEELLLWNTQAKDWTIEKEQALLAQGTSREAVGLQKFPHREKLAKSNGRALSKYAQSKYMADMARKADPTWTPPVPAGAEPPAPTPAPAADVAAETPITELGG